MMDKRGPTLKDLYNTNNPVVKTRRVVWVMIKNGLAVAKKPKKKGKKNVSSKPKRKTVEKKRAAFKGAMKNKHGVDRRG